MSDRIEILPAHAKLAPSAANGWMTCPDYVNAQEGFADATCEPAAEGTFAHGIRDFCLEHGFDAHDFIGTKGVVAGYPFTWNDDDADLLQPGMDWLREQEGHFVSEHRVDLSHWLGADQFGTLDAAVVTADLIIIDDLKWGRGIPVSAVGNKQLQLYALGFWWNTARHMSDAKQFLISIDQPRHAGGGGQWEVTLDELLAFGETARAAAAATREPNPPRVASLAGCQWCRAKDHGACKVFDAYNLELLGAEFDDLDGGALELPDTDGLTPSRRSVLVQHWPMIDKWLERLEAATLADALSGNDAGGMKAVPGRKAADKWLNAEVADRRLKRHLGERRFTKKLMTPTQARKALPTEDLRHLIIPGERKPILVPAADSRPAMTAVDEFDDL